MYFFFFFSFLMNYRYFNIVSTIKTLYLTKFHVIRFHYILFSLGKLSSKKSKSNKPDIHSSPGEPKQQEEEKTETTTTKMSLFGFFLPGIYNKCQIFYILVAYIF